MTKNNAFKTQVRTRMALTGESYKEAYTRLFIPSNKLTVDNFFTTKQLEALDSSMNQHEGVILVRGLVNSGKTCAMKAYLDYVVSERQKRVLLLEEYEEFSYASEKVRDSAYTNSMPLPLEKVLSYPALYKVDDADLIGVQEYTSAIPNIFWRASQSMSFITTMNINGRLVEEIIPERLESVSGIVNVAKIGTRKDAIYLTQVLLNTSEALNLLRRNAPEAEMAEYAASQGVVTIADQIQQLEDRGTIRRLANSDFYEIVPS